MSRRRGLGSVDRMSISTFSHVAIGVRDMDVALPFWRDVVGLHVSLDTVEEMPQGDGKPRRSDGPSTCGGTTTRVRASSCSTSS